jgi:hypothetical protein
MILNASCMWLLLPKLALSPDYPLKLPVSGRQLAKVRFSNMQLFLHLNQKPSRLKAEGLNRNNAVFHTSDADLMIRSSLYTIFPPMPARTRAERDSQAKSDDRRSSSKLLTKHFYCLVPSSHDKNLTAALNALAL